MVLFVAFLPVALGAEITNIIAPQKAWIDESIKISYTCSNSTELQSPVTLVLEKLDPSQWKNTLDATTPVGGENFTATWNIPMKNKGPGIYRVTLKCNDAGNLTNKTIDITVREFYFGKIEQTLAYSDDEIGKLTAIILVNDGQSEKAVWVPAANWDAIANEKEILISSASEVINGIEVNILTLNLLSLGLEKNKENTIPVTLKATYEGATISTTRNFETKDPVEFSIKQGKVEVEENMEITLDIEVAKYHNSTLTLKQSDLTITLNEIELTNWNLEGTKIKISLPPKNPGKYTLLVTANFKTITKMEEIQVIYLVKVFGKVLNAEGNPMTGRIIFDSGEVGKSLVIGGDGNYLANLITGNYTVTLAQFRGLRSAAFYGVTLIRNIENLFCYDMLTRKNLHLPGFKIAGGIVLSFALPFQFVKLEIEYDDRAYPGLDEQKLQVMKCVNWNFGQRICNSEWEELSDFEIYSMGPGGYVTLQLHGLSAILIGEKDTLQIKSTLRPEKEKYFLNEQIEVQGIVSDTAGNPVGNLEIYYKLREESHKTKTNKDGIFSFTIITPSSEGAYELEISTQSTVYNNDKKIHTLQVISKVDLSIKLPPSPQIPVDKTTTITIQISNIGQKSLKNLAIEVRGLNEFESYSPSTIEELGVGEEKTVTINLLPKSIGPREIKILVSNPEIGREGSLAMLVSPVAEEEVETITNQTQPSQLLPGLTQFTGMLVSTIKTNLNFLSLLVFCVVVFTVLKSVRRRERRVKDDILSFGKKLQEILETREMKTKSLKPKQKKLISPQIQKKLKYGKKFKTSTKFRFERLGDNPLNIFKREKI
ncbi:MAG: carboxypeptidase-like regulatory domain-containing protein [Candidatus Aenigmarchaeota archaeon]|nr:carboxypeptidase-like regulatory domain-containing protein [Candidatus Aenigmarchaeota archaeon]